MRLYGYWRSSAAYRVRIALNWKGVEFEQGITDLRRGEHRTLTYLEKNPQGLVPMLEEGDVRLTQSLAIIEALEETRPEPPLLPEGTAERARCGRRRSTSPARSIRSTTCACSSTSSAPTGSTTPG
jgi:maleylpyruvate isomerase